MPRILSVFLFLLSTVGMAAAVAGPEVEITNVKFANVRAPNGAGGAWLEAEIALNVHPVPGTPGQMVSRVRVALTIAFELPALAGGERRLEHYHAEAECVALEPGRTDVRFYLPPELVKRDQLHGDPKYWGVELSVGGRALPAGHGSYSASLTNADARKNFQSRAAAAAAANDGLLQPQYLTSFANAYPQATPSFARREPR